MSGLVARVAAHLRRLGNRAAPNTVRATVLSEAIQTMAGQPLVLPQAPVQVSATEVVMPAGSRLPMHQHPWPRYGYVLSGRLRVVYPDGGRVVELSAGEFALEGVGVWHSGEVIGPGPLRLLVIDQAPPGQVNLVVKPDHSGAAVGGAGGAGPHSAARLDS